jgi:hypothetical protein
MMRRSNISRGIRYLGKCAVQFLNPQQPSRAVRWPDLPIHLRRMIYRKYLDEKFLEKRFSILRTLKSEEIIRLDIYEEEIQREIDRRVNILATNNKILERNPYEAVELRDMYNLISYTVRKELEDFVEVEVNIREERKRLRMRERHGFIQVLLCGVRRV